MTPPKVAEMTLEELKVVVANVVDERLRDRSIPPVKMLDPRKLQEVFDSIDLNLITPRSGESTGSEMILEEREQWRKGM